MRNKASKVLWDIIIVKNRLCFFTDNRIDRNSIPDGYNMYEVADCCDGVPSYLAKKILVNFYGTLITKEKFEFNDRYYDIEQGEWNNQSTRFYSYKELLELMERGELP